MLKKATESTTPADEPVSAASAATPQTAPKAHTADPVSQLPSAPAASTAASTASTTPGSRSYGRTVPEPAPIDPEKKKLADSLFATDASAAPAASTKRASRARKGGAASSGAGGGRAARRAQPIDSGGDLLNMDGGEDTRSAAGGSSGGGTGGSLLDDLAGMSLGGGNSNDNDTLPPPPSYAAAQHAPHTAPSQHATAAAGEDDLLGGLDLLGGSSMGSASSHSAAPSTAAATAGGGSVDLLDLLGGDVPASSTGNSDHFGGLLAPTPAGASAVSEASVSPTGSSSAAQSSSDPFNMSLGSMASGLGASSAAAAAGGATQAQLPAELAEYPHQGPTELVGDAALGVSIAKVWRPEALDVVLFFHNKTDKTTSGLVTRLDSPRAAPRVDAQATTTKLTHSVGPLAVRQQVLSFACTASMTAGMALKGHSAYTASGANHSLNFSVPLLPTDFLRPLAITTERFGALWQAPGADRSKRVQPTRGAEHIEALAARAEQELRLHRVQIIGDEVIMASQVCFIFVVLIHLGVERCTCVIYV